MEPPEDRASQDDIALNPRFRENEGALLHALLQATDYGILMSGLDRQDIMANRRLGELFGLAPQQIVEIEPEGARAMARAQVQDPVTFEEVLRRTYADPELTYEDELALVTEPARTLRRFTGPVRDCQGALIGRIWTFQDITETKRLQAEVQAQLAARTADYQATSGVLQAMNDLCRVALQHQETQDLLAAIAALVRPFGAGDVAAVLLLSRDGTELTGAAAWARSAPKPLRFSRRSDTALAEALARTQADPKTPLTLYPDYSGPLARKLKCGTVCVAPLCSQNRAFGALVFGFRDSRAAQTPSDSYRAAHLNALVDQVALTLETHRLQSELHETLETLKTTQRRMVEFEKLRTAGTLAASVAHDIRNIVTTMEMEMALEPALASEPLCAQLNRFSALTHRLLAFSRPSVLETHPTSVTESLRRIIPLLAGQAQISSVEVQLDLPETLPLVAADASQLEHLFVNLCLNAIQAMNTAGGTLSITARATRHWLKIAVQDTGPGIPPEAIGRLFDPFFTTRATGFGLGLFSCKRIVEEHGGQLTVTSAPGKGACFTVMLPALP